jgi:hypothetical protein
LRSWDICLFLYPGFLLYRAAREAFSVICFHDVRCIADAVRFEEQEGVPTDSTVVGTDVVKGKQGRERPQSQLVPQ